MPRSRARSVALVALALGTVALAPVRAQEERATPLRDDRTSIGRMERPGASPAPPATFSIGGFTLTGAIYDRVPSTRDGLSGKGSVAWTTPAGTAPVDVAFRGVTFGGAGRDGVVPALTGVAALREGSVASLALAGHEVRVVGLSVEPTGARAALEYDLPAALGGDTVRFDDVEVRAGGAFVAVHRFGPREPDRVAAGDGPDLRIAGARLVLDFDAGVEARGEVRPPLRTRPPELSIDPARLGAKIPDPAVPGAPGPTGAVRPIDGRVRIDPDLGGRVRLPAPGVPIVERDPSWTGIVIGPGIARVAVRPAIAPAEAARDLFFVERPERAFLFGRFDRLEIAADGTVSGSGLRAVPPALIRPFAGPEPDDVLALFLPAGFGLEIQGGVFDLDRGRVADVDLRGRVHLPPEFESAPLRFAHLRRSADPTDGFETDEIAAGLPPVRLGEFSYRPARGRFRVPGLLLAASRIARVDLSPEVRPPDEPAQLAAWETAVRDRIDGDGLLVWGGVLVTPWPAAAPPVTRGNPDEAPAPATPIFADRPISRIGGPATGIGGGRPKVDTPGRLPGRIGDPGKIGDPGTIRPSDPSAPVAGSSPKVPAPSTGGTVKIQRPADTTGVAGPGAEVESSLSRLKRILGRGEAVLEPALRAPDGVDARGATGGFARPALAGVFDANVDLGRFLGLPELHARQGGAFLLKAGNATGRWMSFEDPGARAVGAFTAEIDRTSFEFRQSALLDGRVLGRLLVPYPSRIEIPFHGRVTLDGDVLVAEDGLVPPPLADGWSLDYWHVSVFPKVDSGGTAGTGASPGIGKVRRDLPGRRGAPRTPGRLEASGPAALLDDFKAPVSARIDAGAAAPSLRLDGADRDRMDRVVPIDERLAAILQDLELSTGRTPIDPGPRPALLFYGDRIVVPYAEMRLDVAEDFGGLEIRRSDAREDEAADRPFLVSLVLRPDGQVEDVEIRPSGGMTFLELPFHPRRSTIEMRRYIGDHRPPDADAPPLPTWLVRLRGDLEFNLFGRREILLHHTAMGARVPFVEPTAKDSQGRPAPVVADSAGVLFIDATLRFVNTFGVPEEAVRRVFPNPPVGADDVAYDLPPRSQVGLIPFKAFVGEGRISILKALSVNGLAEAGVWLDVQDGLRAYEKVGVGGGVDVVRAVLAGLRGLETVAELGGAVVEVTTGAEGLGAEVVHVVVDATQFVSSVATTAVAVAGVVGSGGGSTAHLADEIRNLVGNGLELSASSVDLTKAIYEQEPWYEAPPGGTVPEDPKRHPPYVAMELADILLTASAAGVQFEDLEPRKIASILLQSLDTGMPLLQAMEIGDIEADRKIDAALILSHAIVIAARDLVDTEQVHEETVWAVLAKLVEAADLMRQFEEVRQFPEVEKPLELAVRIADVSVQIARAIRVGEGEVRLASLVDLTDQILTLMCEHYDLVGPLVGELGGDPRDVGNLLGLGQTTFEHLADPAFLDGTLPPERAVVDVVVPMLDDLADGRPVGTCTVSFAPYDAEARALLRVARQVLSVARFAEDGAVSDLDGQVALYDWSLGTVQETLRAVDVLQPGSVDDRVLATVGDFRAAGEAIDASKPPVAQALGVVEALMPTVRRAIELVPDVDPNVPRTVDVVAAAVSAARPIADGNERDVGLWLDGSIEVLDKVRRLPLQRDVLAGVQVATRSLELARDAERGTLSPRGLVRGAREIVDTLRDHRPAVVPRGAPAVASIDPAVALAATPASLDARPVFAVASSLLGALEATLTDGEFSVATVGDLLVAIAGALAPAGGNAAVLGRGGIVFAADGGGAGLASLGTAVRALPLLDPTVDAATAGRRVIEALLDAERATTGDARVADAVDRARVALLGEAPEVRGTRPDFRVYPAPAVDDVGETAVDGVRREVGAAFEDPEDGPVRPFTVVYPEGHADFPGGLREVYRVEQALVDAFEAAGGLSGRTLQALEAELSTRGVRPVRRAYRDPQGREVDYSAEDANLGAVVTVREPGPAGDPFAPRRTFAASRPPAPNEPADALSGPLVEAVWRVSPQGPWAHHRTGSGLVRVDGVAGPESFEVREVPPDLQPLSVGDVPLGGRLLAYRGPDARLLSGQALDWRAGDPFLLVLSGRSYDRRRVDPALAVPAPSALPLSGDLVERRVHLGDDEGYWLFRPGERAIRVRPCGEWAVHDLIEDEFAIPSPDPTELLATSAEPVARGTASGEVFRPDGSAMPESEAELQWIFRVLVTDAGADVVTVMAHDMEKLMQAAEGVTGLLPDSGRRRVFVSACAQDGSFAEGWTDGLVEEVRLGGSTEPSSSRATFLGQDRATIRRVRAGERLDVVQGRADGVVVVEIAPDADAATCATDGAVRQSFRYRVDGDLVVAAHAALGLTRPERNDRAAARRVLATRRLLDERSATLREPTLDRLDEYLAFVRESRREGRLDEGARAQADVAVARTLSKLALPVVEEIEAAAADVRVGRGWLAAGADVETPLDRLLLVLGHADEQDFEVSPRAFAAVARAIPQQGADGDLLATLAARAVAGLGDRCQNAAARLRIQGLRTLAAGLRAADPCGQGATFDARVADLFASTGDVENRCMARAIDAPQATPEELRDRIRDAMRREAQAQAAGTPSTLDPAVLDRAVDSIVDDAAAKAESIAGDPNRTRADADRALSKLLGDLGDAQSLGAGTRDPGAVVRGAIKPRVDRQRTTLDGVIAACDLETRASQGCDAATLAGCAIGQFPQCESARLRPELRNLISDKSIAEMTDYDDGVDDDPRFRKLLRALALHAASDAEAGWAAGDVDRFRSGLDRLPGLLAEADGLGLPSAALADVVGAWLGRFQQRIEPDLATALAAGGGDAASDDRVRMALEVVLTAGDFGTVRGSLRDAVRPRLPALRDRDRARALDLASSEGALYPGSERIARSLFESARGTVAIVQGDDTGAAAIAFEDLVSTFVDGLRDNRGALLAAPVPEPDALADDVDVPVPGLYPSATLHALLRLSAAAGADPAIREEAAAYLERVALRFQPYIPPHRKALARWVEFGKNLLDDDAAARTRAGLEPVPLGTDPIARALHRAARRAGDLVLAAQLGTLERERAQEQAADFARKADDLERTAQSDPRLVEADPGFRAQVDDGVRFLRDLSAEAQERADALPFSSFGGDLGSDDALRAADTMALEEPEVVLLAADSGAIVSAVSLSMTAGVDPWSAAAIELDAVADQAGPDARLALRLLRGLPDPDVAGDFGFRTAAIPEIAGFVVEELGLASPAGRGPAPAVLGAGSAGWDPQRLIESVLTLLLPRAGVSPGGQLAELTAVLLSQAGADTDDPVVRVGLQVGAAAVDGAVVALRPAAAGRPVPWLDVLEEAGTRLAAVDLADGRPEDVWLALSGRSMRVGARAAKGELDEALLGESLEVALLFLDQPQVASAVEGTPEPGRAVLRTTREVLANALDPSSGDTHVDVALARSVARTTFDAVEGDYAAFGRALAEWSLDFADDHHDLLAGIAASGEPSREQMRQLVDALLTPTGAASLACAVQDHVPETGVALPPALVQAPLVATKEMLRSSSAGDGSEDRARAMIDVAAGLLNLTLSPAGTATCEDLRPLPEDDVGFALSVRGLKDLDLNDPAEAFRLIGLVGVGAVDTFLPGSTWANVLRIVWYGDVAVADPGTGLQKLLMTEPFSADFLETAMSGPQVAGKVVAELSDDPGLRRTMQLLAGRCEDDMLLPPDTCHGPPESLRRTDPTRFDEETTNATLPNTMLGVLADLRRQMAPELSRQQHRSHPQFGYLRTIPVLAGDGSGPSLERFGDPTAWQQTVAGFDDLEHTPANLKRAGLAGVDLARMAVDAIASLSKSHAAGASADQILSESVFAPQVGGETYSGVAGGLMREWPPGHPEQSDLYFELVGQFVIPALVKVGAQMTFQSAGGDWALMLRAAGNYPDLDAMGRELGIAIPFNDIGSAVLGQQEMGMTGWLGVANDELYAQVYAFGDMRRGASTMSNFSMSGFVRDFPTSPGVDPVAAAAGLDLGVCGELEQQLLVTSMDPQMSLLTMGLGATIRMGGFMAKRDGVVEVGYKVGSATEWNVPGFPVAGVRFGVDLGASAAGGIAELDFNGSDDATLSGAFGYCVSPFLSGYFFGIELEEVRATLDVEFFGTVDLENGAPADGEAGMLLSFEIPEQLEGVVGGVMGCPVNPGAAAVCAAVADPDEPLLGWMAFSNRAYYLGLGPKPKKGDMVVGGDIVDGVPQVPDIVTVDWRRSDVRTTGACSPDMCIEFLGPPPGVAEIGPPDTGSAP